MDTFYLFPFLIITNNYTYIATAKPITATTAATTIPGATLPAAPLKIGGPVG